MDLNEIGRLAKAAQPALQKADTAAKNQVLHRAAELLVEQCDFLLKENEKDMENGRTNGMPEGLLDRLLLTEQSEKRRLGHADHLETDSRNITHSVTRTTETGNQHLVVLVHVVQATIARNEGSDLLAVLDQLHTHALTHGRVGLLRLDTDLLNDDALGVRRATEGGRPLRRKVRLVVGLVSPALKTTSRPELACSTDTSRSTHDSTNTTKKNKNRQKQKKKP